MCFSSGKMFGAITSDKKVRNHIIWCGTLFRIMKIQHYEQIWQLRSHILTQCHTTFFIRCDAQHTCVVMSYIFSSVLNEIWGHHSAPCPMNGSREMWGHSSFPWCNFNHNNYFQKIWVQSKTGMGSVWISTSQTHGKLCKFHFDVIIALASCYFSY